MRKDAPLAVEVPSPERDNPGWVKVGVIAAVGFVLGVAWPRVVGVKIGPSAPGESASAAAAAASSASAHVLDAPPASVAVTKASAAVPSASVAATAGPPQINVLKGNVLGCKSDDGDSKKGKECGSVGALDNIVAPRIKKISTCAGAEGQTGKLSFIVHADFVSGGFSWEVGKSSTLANVDGVTSCLKTEFKGVVVSNIAHENSRYTVAYTAIFAPAAAGATEGDAKDTTAKDPKADAKAKDDPKASGDSTPADAPAATGEASVGWEVALVRDAPKTGAVVARLPRGSKVKLGALKDGFYAIKFGDGFTSDGWVYRGALGR